MPATGMREIGILVYPGVQMAAVHGLTDLLNVAAGIARDEGAGRPVLRVNHWQPARDGDADLSCIYDSAQAGKAQPAILVIPPTMVKLPDPNIPSDVVSWLKEQYAAGVILVSVCSGAFILAKTGLADGRAVATHQICKSALAERFPQITVDTDRRIIDHGDIISAGGFLAWVDVGLFLVDRILGAAVKAETARFILSGASCHDAPLFCRFSSAAVASRQADPEGPGMGTYARWLRRRTCLYDGHRRIAETYISPPVCESNRHDAARILPRDSHRACA